MRLSVSSIAILTLYSSVYSMSLFRSTNSKREHIPQEIIVPTTSAQSTAVPITPAFNQATLQTITVNVPISVQLQNTNTNSVQVEQTVYTQVWQKTQTQIQQTFDWLKNYSTLHKKQLAVYALVACYTGIQTTIFYLQHKLQNKHWWSFWYQEKNLQQLYTIPQKQLTHELLSAIQTRYTTVQNPLDYATPLVLFTRDLEREITLLTRYKKIIATLERLKLSTLFFYKRQLILEYTERLNRLAYIKSCFFNSLIEHKVNYIQ